MEDQLTVENVDSLAEDWSVALDEGMSEKIVVGDRIYTTATRLSDDLFLDVLAVRSYDLDSGDLVWERPFLPEGIDVEGEAHPVALVDGALWVSYWHGALPDCTSRLLRLHQGTGEVLTSEVTDRIGSPIVSRDGTVSYVTYDCGGSQKLVVRDAATLEEIWSFEFPDGAYVATPTMTDDRIFVIARDAVYAFDLDECNEAMCEPMWRHEYDYVWYGEPRPVVGPTGEVYIEYRSVVQSLDGDTGEVLWESHAEYDGLRPTIGGFAVAYGNLYVLRTYDRFGADQLAELAVYPAGGCGEPSCLPSWRVTFPYDPPWDGDRHSGEPTVAGGVVYFGLSNRLGRPSIVAVDAHGCGEDVCSELTRLYPIDGYALSGAGPGNISVAHGRLVVGVRVNSFFEGEFALKAYSATDNN